MILPDVLAPNLDVVFCGTAAGRQSAQVGAYYAGNGNKFWRTLVEVGLTPRVLAPSEYMRLTDYGIGLTDVVKDASGSDDDICFRGCRTDAFALKIAKYAPRVLAFNGKKAAATFFACPTGRVTYGQQAGRIGTTVVFVLPSTSGAASGYWDMAYWRALSDVVKASATE